MDNISAFQSHEQIMEEARAWVLAFNSDQPPSPEQIAALKQWAARSPAHRSALQEAEDFWCEAELLSQLAVPRPRARNLGAGLAGQCRRWLAALARPRGMAAAVVTTVALGLAVLWLPPLGSVGNGLYTTAVGEQATLTLRDRSVVRLDTNSQLQIEYRAGLRKLTLLQGKAHFEVAKNPQQPFEVYAREGLVRAVGTAFSVYLLQQQQAIEVVVDEGRVELARTRNKNATAASDAATPEPAFLSVASGHSVWFDRQQQNLVQLDSKTLSQKQAWREGVLVFVRDPLRDVVSEISRYTDTRIEIADPALGQLIIGGRFRAGELDALFEVLEIGFGVKVSRISEDHVRLDAAGQPR